MQVVVLAGAATTCAYDLSVGGGGKKQSSVYFTPRVMCKGAMAVSRLLELEDVPFGTAFADLQYSRYNLRNLRTIPLTALLLLAAPPW